MHPHSLIIVDPLSEEGAFTLRLVYTSGGAAAAHTRVSLNKSEGQGGNSAEIIWG
jgi:hypothetical protein